MRHLKERWMKHLAFNSLRGLIRFLFTIPGRVRLLWRTLLVWCRVSRIYHRSGMEGLKRWRSVRGIRKGILRRKSSPGKGSSRTPFPPYQG